jgi:signal transduction histidine kinase
LSAVQRLYTTISHLLSFAAEPNIAADVLSVASLFEDLQEDCRPMFVNSLSSITFACESDLPPLWADRGLLTQAVLNLIVNSKEAMPSGGWIRIEARLSSFSAISGQIHRAIEIEVTDEGVGIAPENRERIFDPFFTTKSEGTGLGLAFTHQIITAHGGSITISSNSGQGTQIRLCLPAAEEIDAHAKTNCHS